jgi:hypothetical protein
MKAILLLTVLCAMAIGAEAQTATATPVSVISCKWTRAGRSQGGSGDQERKAKDAATNQQIAIANREAEGTGQPSGEAQELEARKHSQVALIPLPSGVVKGYLYKVQVRNVADRAIKRLQWSYVFTDVLTQQELVRKQFYSRTRIQPGHEKRLSVFTRGAPPAVINVKELSRNGGKPWVESVVIESVEFADGTTWSPPAKADQVKPANN